ncbi:Uncharacterised protein [Streptococcus pneumoniae]|nr:Uncharacterised protein [Streptococcus pneumoniae]
MVFRFGVNNWGLITLSVDLIFLPGAETSGFKSKSILGPQDVDPAGTMISSL